MELKLLDHGYVKLIPQGSWGSDEIIIESARMSTEGSFKGWEDRVAGDGSLIRGDARLLRYLWKNKHYSPFEMAGLTVEVQAPIFVFREWHRHRTQSYNELSARYTELPELFYIPNIERLKTSKQSTKNKQGSEDGFTEQQATDYELAIKEASYHARGVYERLLRAGVAREIARLVIPVNQYSRMRASANLRNWLAFLTLRMDPAAQWEIRQYANVLHTILTEHFPKVMELFDETRSH